MSDAHRFLHLARSYYNMGDPITAERILLNLSTILDGQEKYKALHIAIQKILSNLKTASKSGKKGEADNFSLAKSSLQQAEKYLKEKQKERAASILLSLITLYDGDSQSAKEVEKAKKILDQLKITYPRKNR